MDTHKTCTKLHFFLKGCVEKDPKWHQIDCKILLANCFSLPSLKKENSTWDQESLTAFFHPPLHLGHEWYTFYILASEDYWWRHFLLFRGCLCEQSVGLHVYNKKKITRWLQDMNITLSCQKQYSTHFRAWKKLEFQLALGTSSSQILLVLGKS